MTAPRESDLGTEAKAEPAPANCYEHGIITPAFCDGLHTVEIDRHGLARLAFFHDQRECYEGRMERVLATRLILPAAVLVDIAARLLAASRRVEPEQAQDALGICRGRA